MAEFLILLRRDRPGKPRGTIVAAKDHELDGSAPTWGCMEDKDHWIAEGRNVREWPGMFAIYSNPALTVAEYRAAVTVKRNIAGQDAVRLDEAVLNATAVAQGETAGRYRGDNKATFLAALRVD